MSQDLLAFAAVLIGYLFGSITFGVLLTKIFGAGDLRKIGSGNIGATNVLRTGKRGAAAATVLFDAGKGTAAVLLGQHFVGDIGALYAGLGAFIGHVYPIWLKFKGGKGFATFLGVALGLAWPLCAALGATWLAIAFLFRISSLAALVAAAAAPFYFYFYGLALYAALFAALAVLVFSTHRANIGRLLAGNEPNIGK